MTRFRSFLINKSTRIGREPSRYSGQTSSLLHTSFSSTFTAARKLACQSITVFIFCRDIVVPPTSSIAPPVLNLYYFWKKLRPNGQKIRCSIRMNCCNSIITQKKPENKLNFYKKGKSHRAGWLPVCGLNRCFLLFYFAKVIHYIILRNRSFRSSTLASFGFPGAHASACADSARN